MRLTLRTLLAYLDDVLEPSEAKEIGKKLQESPVATTLVSRLREVMRRRRLAAPDLEGPGVGIDPNLVAQYLDNTLPPEQVAEVEKICLESDQQLAEVAACHQILTLALGEPVEIPPSTRERLYVLGPVDASEKLEAGEAPHRGNGSAALRTPVSMRTIPGSAGPSFEESLPDYLKAKSWSGKTVAFTAGILLLLAVWLGAVLSEQNTFKAGIKGLRTTPAQKPESVTATEPEPVKEEVVEEIVAVIPAETNTNTATPPATKPPATKPATEKPAAVEVAQADDRPADASPDPLPPPPEPGLKEEPMPAKVAPKLVTSPMQYMSTEGVLLQLDANDKSWYVVPKQARLKANTLLACPEPFEAIVSFDGGTKQVTLLGDTMLELLPASEHAPVTLRLLRGQIILRGVRKEEKAAPIGFIVGPRAGVLDFGEGETFAGLEYQLREPIGFQQPISPADQLEGMYVLTGAVTWAPFDEPARIASQGIYIRMLTDQLPINFGPPLGSNPDWLDPQRRKLAPLRRFAKQFEKEFELNQPIDSSMRALIRDTRAKVSELAIRSLSLTENYTALVQAMAQVEHEDARKAALAGLKTWLGARPDRGETLLKVLATFYERDYEIAAIYRLLWGISEQEAKTPQTSFDVVEWLRSDKVEIRELAFSNLVRLTGRKYDYRPLASAQHREPAVKRWYEHVQREGAILKPE